MNAPLRVPTSTRTPFLLSATSVPPTVSRPTGVRIDTRGILFFRHRQPGPGDLRQPGQLDHRPDFNRTPPRSRDPRGNVHRFVEILRLNQVVPAELLPRFRERTVGHQTFPVSHPDAGRS